MKTSEILNKAADLIEERGWRQCPTGRPGTSDPLCIEEALEAVAGPLDGGIGAAWGWRHPALMAVWHHLALSWGEGVFRWNDRPGRTKEEVIEVLRATALIEQVKERQHALDEAPKVAV